MESSELIPGTREALILGAVSGGPRHGYGIAQAIRQTSGGFPASTKTGRC